MQTPAHYCVEPAKLKRWLTSTTLRHGDSERLVTSLTSGCANCWQVLEQLEVAPETLPTTFQPELLLLRKLSVVEPQTLGPRHHHLARRVSRDPYGLLHLLLIEIESLHGKDACHFFDWTQRLLATGRTLAEDPTWQSDLAARVAGRSSVLHARAGEDRHCLQIMEAAWLAFEGGTHPKELELELFFASAEGLAHLGARRSAVRKIFEAGLRVLDPEEHGALRMEALNTYGSHLVDHDEPEHAHPVLLDAAQLTDHHMGQHPATAALIFYNLARVELELADLRGPRNANQAGSIEKYLERIPLEWANDSQRLDIETLRRRARKRGS